MSMTQDHRDKLIRNRVAFVSDLQPDMVLEHLLQDNIVTQDMKERVKNSGARHAQVSELMDLIPKRGDIAFQCFVRALYDTHQDFLAKLLEQ